MEGAENPVILMLHGFLGNARNWSECATALSAHWRVLAPPLPFFGVRHQEDCLEHLIRFLDELLTVERAERVIAVGNSLGGQLAVNLAVRKPEQFAGLVLTGSSGFYKRNLVSRIQRRPEREWLRGRIREIFYDAAHVTEEMVDTILDIASSRQKLLDTLLLARSIRKLSVRELLPQVRCPVLLIWGEDDKITPPCTALEFQSLLPDAKLHYLPRCGHAAMMEQPEEFTRLTEDFLRRITT